MTAPRRGSLAGGPPAAQQPITGIPFFTIMLDISANLLCVVVLLLTISAAARPGRMQTAETSVPIMTDRILAPAGLVEAFRLRTVRDESVSTIDLRRRHVEVKPAGASPSAAVPLSLDDPGFASLLRRTLPPAPGTILVFVFSQERHATLRGSLDGLAASVTEVDVPLALRTAAADSGWSDGFRAFFGRELRAETFPEQLARIIAGGSASDRESTLAQRSGGAGGTGSTIWTALQIGWRLSLLLLSVLAIAVVGRMRPRAP